MRKWTLLVGLCLLALPFATAQDGVQISGLVDIGFVHNFNDPGKTQGTDILGLYDAKEDAFIPGAAKVVVSKEAADVGTAGFELTLDFLAQAGLVDEGTGSAKTGSTLDDIAVRTANIVYKADIGNGLTITAGKMENVVGKDRIDTASNAHMTHGLLFNLHPLTQVGVRASYAVVENLTATLGVNNGGDQDIDDNHGKSIEAALSFSPTEAISLDLNLNYGAEGSGAISGLSNNVVWQDANGDGVVDPGELVAVPVTVGEESDGKLLLLNAIANWDVTEEASVYAELTYGNEENDAEADWPESDLDDQQDLTVVGLGLGGTYWFTDKYGLSARYEYLDVGSTSPDETGTYLWEVTITGSAKLTEDLLFRLEFRYDKANVDMFDDDSTDDASPGADDAQAVLGAQLIYTF